MSFYRKTLRPELWLLLLRRQGAILHARHGIASFRAQPRRVDRPAACPGAPRGGALGARTGWLQDLLDAGGHAGAAAGCGRVGLRTASSAA